MPDAVASRKMPPGLARWLSLAELAVRGLRATYAPLGGDALPHTRRIEGARGIVSGRNPRYGLISLLGLARAREIVGAQDDLVDALWARIEREAQSLERSPGDLGLGLWAAALHGEPHGFTVERAAASLQANARTCDSVHLAWLLLGADHAVIEQGASDAAESLAEEAKISLLELFNSDTSLFYRHAPRGPHRAVSRRVACFANQIYPVMALAVHARRTRCPRARRACRDVADNLCQFQGELGQWWWLYDAATGPVVDGYPVFSVHQDGMAPMALLEVQRTGLGEFDTFIERGLDWLFGRNEVHENMILADEFLIRRDVHRRGAGRFARMWRGLTWCAGLRRPIPQQGPEQCEINAECRPYHLGWVLYAAALMNERATAGGPST